MNNIFTGKVYIYTTYPLSIIENNSSGLEDFYISQNFPNPFNSQTTINYFLPRDGLIKFKVLNILGQQMLKTTYEYKQAGSHTFELNLDELPSGIYIYKIDFSFNNNFKKGFDSKTKKMLLIK